MAYKGLLANVYNRFLDWADDVENSGDNITNVAIDYINRAQEEIRAHRLWEELITREPLTVTNRVASLPSDLGEIVSIGGDSNGDGKIDFYYYQDSNDEDKGYYITNTYTKAAGKSQTLTFYLSPQYTPILLYVKTLEDFTAAEATGGTDIYLFYPESLMLAKAKEIYLLDGDLIGDELTAVQNEVRNKMADYEAGHQYVNIDIKRDMLDDEGQIVDMEGYDIYRGTSGIKSNFSNSYDFG